MLCRTGLVWESTVDGQELTFELVGVNNQNFIMTDHQTGTWWQQVNGKAIRGPLKGKVLERVPSEITTWGLWRNERPGGRVLDLEAIDTPRTLDDALIKRQARQWAWSSSRPTR